MMNLLIPLLFLCADPQIKGSTTVEQYKLVQLNTLNVSEDTAVLWDIYPEELVDIKEYSDGSLVFVGPPGDYKVKLRLINGRNVSTLRTTVKITGTAPKPGPVNPDNPVNPVNPVNPPKPLPDGKFKLAAKSKDWTSQVTSPTKVSEAQALAGSLDSVIAAANAGTVASVDDFMRLTRDTNRQALGAAAALWQPWFQACKNELDTLYDAKLLKNLDDYKDAYSEMSLGLRSVK